MATLVVPPIPPCPRDDAMHLHHALKGLKCDTDAVVNLLAHRDATQRANIVQEFRAIYSEELSECLEKELHGKLESAILLWMHDPVVRDAVIIRQCLAVDSSFHGATEIICSRTHSQMQSIKEVYLSKFGASVDHDVEAHTSADHKKILLAYLNNPRDESDEVDMEQAGKDAKALYKAGEKRLGTDEDTFIKIFSERSAPHLVAVNSYYNHVHGHSLKKAVKNETSGHFRHALLTIVQCAENPAKYFAKVLYKSMKGLGTDDVTLTRVIVTRTEIDMHYIKIEYFKKYHKTLNDAVHSDTLGHYRDFLLQLLGPNV
ncbi:annexin D5-like [Arachis duranensis]|uniref:Annexin n=1 Tax=Arachis duranensis TaxID=130453 RepID=A0A6P4DGQ4_ARADU|nr:annexin D5-like [Arachis duranensis]